MAKYVPEQHITGELGVNIFHNYCLRHDPPILFRSETTSDFGIDGEVELTKRNQVGKLEASGEIIKVQIKSTKTGSYIKKENDQTFEFHATPDDIQYWNDHNLDVILVVFDQRTEKLYATKIDQIAASYKKSKMPIIFNKADNELSKDDDFRNKFSARFKGRVDFAKSETLFLNLFPYSKLPKVLYQFDSQVKNPKDIFAKMKGYDIPNFKIVGDVIYTFYNPVHYKYFKENILIYSTKKSSLHFRSALQDDKYYNICIELLNKQFKEIVRSQRVWFERKYSRYFFAPMHDDFDEKRGHFRERSLIYKSKKGRESKRKVVIYRTYAKDTFYRHFAFETNHILVGADLYMVITPKYLFTSDGRTPLGDTDLITKLTNYMTAREWNEQILNHTHFIYSALSDKSHKITLCEIDGSEISVARYMDQEVGFSIPLDYRPKKVTLNQLGTQTSMFE